MKLLFFVLSISLVSCNITPKKIKTGSLVRFGNNDVKNFYNLQKKPTATMDIYEVSARVLKFNLSRRLKQIEQNLSLARLNQFKNKLLPSLNASSNYSIKNKDSLTLTEDINPNSDSYGNISGGSSISSSKSARLDRLTLSWNALDFGVSYLQAKQKTDEFLAARENRRKAIFDLLEKSYTAYWLVVAGQKYEQLAINISKNIEKAIHELANGILAENMPEESLKRQRILLREKRLVSNSLRLIREKKVELASLMGLPAGIEYSVHPHKEVLPLLSIGSSELDLMLFANHPDMRIKAYEERISLADSKIAFFKLFPQLTLSTGLSSTNDRFVVNQNLVDGGISAAWNLLNIFNIHKIRKMNKIERAFARNVRLASGVSLLAAARIKELLYRNALGKYVDDLNLHLVVKQLGRTMRTMKSLDLASFIDVVESEIGMLRSGLDRASSYAGVMRYAMSISNVLSVSDFDYDLNAIGLNQLAENLKKELNSMPITWVSLRKPSFNVPDQSVAQKAKKILSLWKEERERRVPEIGDNKFSPVYKAVYVDYAKMAAKKPIAVKRARRGSWVRKWWQNRKNSYITRKNNYITRKNNKQKERKRKSSILRLKKGMEIKRRLKNKLKNNKKGIDIKRKVKKDKFGLKF